MLRILLASLSSFFRRCIVFSFLHSRSCLRIELTMSIFGWVFSLLISNQSKGGVISFVAVCLLALFTFWRIQYIPLGCFRWFRWVHLGFSVFRCMSHLLLHRPGISPNLFWLWALFILKESVLMWIFSNTAVWSLSVPFLWCCILVLFWISYLSTRRRWACVGIFVCLCFSTLCVLMWRCSLMVLDWRMSLLILGWVMSVGWVVMSPFCSCFWFPRVLLCLWSFVRYLRLSLYLHWCRGLVWYSTSEGDSLVVSLELSWSSRILCCQLGDRLSRVWCPSPLWCFFLLSYVFGKVSGTPMNLPSNFSHSLAGIVIVSFPLFLCARSKVGDSMMHTPPITRPLVFVFTELPWKRCVSRQCGNHQFLDSRFLVGMPLPIAQFSFGVWLI